MSRRSLCRFLRPFLKTWQSEVVGASPCINVMPPLPSTSYLVTNQHIGKLGIPNRLQSFASSSLHSDATSNANPVSIDIAPLEDFKDASIGFTADNILNAASMADSIAVANAAAERWPLIAALQHTLDWAHVASGIPWWGTIALATFTFRTLLFPIMLVQIKNTYRLSQAKPDTEALVQEFQQKMAMGEDSAKTRMWYNQKIAEVWNKHNCNPFKSFLPMFANGFLFISFFLALRGLSEERVPSMCAEGALWFKDLTISDPYYILPITSGLLFLLTVELGAADGMQGQSAKTMKTMKNFMRVLSVAIVPLTANFPASIFCYWISSNAFSLGQTLLLKSHKIKKALGVPHMVPEKTKEQLLKELVGKPLKTFANKPKMVPAKS